MRFGGSECAGERAFVFEAGGARCAITQMDDESFRHVIGEAIDEENRVPGATELWVANFPRAKVKAHRTFAREHLWIEREAALAVRAAPLGKERSRLARGIGRRRHPVPRRGAIHFVDHALPLQGGTCPWNAGRRLFREP